MNTFNPHELRKFDQQGNQYRFPYHYLADLDERGQATRTRSLRWGFEYLCYQNHCYELLRSMCARSLLDVGCGDGYFINRIATAIPERMGVDLVPNAISLARSLGAGARFEVERIENVRERFDAVTLMEVLEHIPDSEVDSFLRSCFARVDDCGAMIICVPSRTRPVHQKHFRHYDESMLRDAIARLDGVGSIEIEAIYREPWWLRLLIKLMGNRFLNLSIPAVETWIWNKIWTDLRHASFGNGTHLVATIRRTKNLHD